LLDFFNLYLVSMYIYHYRNPLLLKSMEKVFWVFPNPTDELPRWNRLHKDVKQQVLWLINPEKLDEPLHRKFNSENFVEPITDDERKLALL